MIVLCYIGGCFDEFDVCMSQCLVAARDGHGAESSSTSFAQLFKLEELLVAGAIPNATMVSAAACYYTYTALY